MTLLEQRAKSLLGTLHYAAPELQLPYLLAFAEQVRRETVQKCDSVTTEFLDMADPTDEDRPWQKGYDAGWIAASEGISKRIKSLLAPPAEPKEEK